MGWTEFDLIEDQVAAIAKGGVRSWYSSPVDIPTLLSLPSVTRELPSVSAADVPLGASREFVAIERALERASDSLPQPFGCAASAHLGFENDPQKKIGVRQGSAATCFGNHERWYRLPHGAFHGLEPQQFVVKLITAALLEVREPRAFVDRLERATIWLHEVPEAGDATATRRARSTATTKAPESHTDLHDEAQELFGSGNYDAALQLFRRLAALRQQQLGRDNLYTLSAVHYTVYSLEKLRRYSEAVVLCEYLVAVRECTLGVDDPGTQDAQGWLTWMLWEARGGRFNRPRAHADG